LPHTVQFDAGGKTEKVTADLQKTWSVVHNSGITNSRLRTWKQR